MKRFNVSLKYLLREPSNIHRAFEVLELLMESAPRAKDSQRIVAVEARILVEVVPQVEPPVVVHPIFKVNQDQLA